MKIRNASPLLLGVSIWLLVSLMLPASGRTWMSNPAHYFLGAEVFPQKDILAMKEGKTKELPDGSRPADPIAFAQRVTREGKLSESGNPKAERYYVIPHLHPKLELLFPALITLAAGMTGLIFTLRRKDA
ncbi:MAG: hypothetical protein NT154_31970 [Verrucomicrobia bacterium]|nr:hypothetical protein [Verrucomicrobiota bacterium]